MSNITCDPKDLSDLNENNMRYIGWETLAKQSPELKVLFSEDVFRKVSAKITDLLKGVHPEGKLGTRKPDIDKLNSGFVTVRLAVWSNSEIQQRGWTGIWKV